MKIFNSLTIIFCFSALSYGQYCKEGLSVYDLNGNNIRAAFRTGGDMFWNGIDPTFVVNKTDFPDVSSIFASCLWMTATDQSLQRKLSVQLYRQENLSYLPFGDNSSECQKWDREWLVNKSDILTHIADWLDNGIIDNKISSIYAWPGLWNPYFQDENGFELPSNIDRLAPFYDRNNDQMYNPDDGDYPILINSKNGKAVIPEQMIWYMITDDAVNGNTDVIPLDIVIQITAWAFKGNDDLINNTIFTNHKLLYYGFEALKDFKVALFTDFDLGCGLDDYIGCDRNLSTTFVYNSDSLDGSSGITCTGTPTFKNDPGVQSVTFLSDTLNSFIYGVNGVNSPSGYTSSMYHPSGYLAFLKYMDTKYLNGNHLLNGGNGTTGIATNFAFDGNPNIPSEWSMKSAKLKATDIFGLPGIYFGDLNPGDVNDFTTAYSYFNNPDLISTASDLDSMYVGVKRLRGIYDNFFEDYVTSTTYANIETIVISPNPANNFIQISNEKGSNLEIAIFDLYGRKVLMPSSSNSNIDVSSLHSGTYIIQVKLNNRSFSQKLIIMH